MNETPLFNITSYSVAGIGTSVHVEANNPRMPPLHIAFDAGQIHFKKKLTDVFISHCHMDHIAGLFLQGRAMFGGSIRFHVPQHAIKPLMQLKQALESLDESEADGVRLIPYTPRKSIKVGAYRVTPIPLRHRVEACGFAVEGQDKLPLPAEYRGLSGPEIRLLYETGVIRRKSDYRTKLFFTGDCTAPSLLSCPEALSAHTLICELTYLCPKTLAGNLAEKHAHVHLAELAGKLNLLRNIKHFHFIHFSQRYSVFQIMKYVRNSFPAYMQDRITLGLGGFGIEHPDREWALYKSFKLKMMDGSSMACNATYMDFSPSRNLIESLATRLAFMHLKDVVEEFDLQVVDASISEMLSFEKLPEAAVLAPLSSSEAPMHQGHQGHQGGKAAPPDPGCANNAPTASKDDEREPSCEEEFDHMHISNDSSDAQASTNQSSTMGIGSATPSSLFARSASSSAHTSETNSTTLHDGPHQTEPLQGRIVMDEEKDDDDDDADADNAGDNRDHDGNGDADTSRLSRGQQSQDASHARNSAASQHQQLGLPDIDSVGDDMPYHSDVSAQYEAEQQAIGCVLYRGYGKSKDKILALLHPLSLSASVFLISTVYPYAKANDAVWDRHLKHSPTSKYIILQLPRGCVAKFRRGASLFAAIREGAQATV